MLLGIVDAVRNAKEALVESLPKVVLCYADIVKAVVEVAVANGVNMDPERIHEIDDGDYQGTKLFLVAAAEYQPTDYFFVRVGYGSCSGCDTLCSIIENVRDDEDYSPKDKGKDLYTLALHVAEGFKPLPYSWEVEDEPLACRECGSTETHESC